MHPNPEENLFELASNKVSLVQNLSLTKSPDAEEIKKMQFFVSRGTAPLVQTVSLATFSPLLGASQVPQWPRQFNISSPQEKSSRLQMD